MPHSTANPSGQNRPHIVQAAHFDETEFTDHIDAQNLTFAHCSLIKAHFRNGVDWSGSRFTSLDLRQAKIAKKADFAHVRVHHSANLAGLETHALLALPFAKIDGNLELSYAKCGGIWLSFAKVEGGLDLTNADLGWLAVDEPPRAYARIDGLEVGGVADFSACRFPYETTFGGYGDTPPARFSGNLKLDRCTFGLSDIGGRHLLRNLDLKSISLLGATFYGRASLAHTRFSSRLNLSDIRVIDIQDDPPDAEDTEHMFPKIALEATQLTCPAGANFRAIHIEGSAAISFAELSGEFEVNDLNATEEISIVGTTFQYLPLELKAKSVNLNRCQFAKGGVISCESPSFSITECDARQPLSIVARNGSGSLQLASLDRTNVEHFALVGVDLSRTGFSGAINLDKIRIQGACLFLRAPGIFGRGREAIFDEAMLRAQTSGPWRKIAPAVPSAHPSPIDVAALYRALRKNREDSKDEPGGADFYYGEMQMRRKAARPLTVEWALLNGYWIISGYGLRAWRAFVTLLVLVGVAGAGLSAYGHTGCSPSWSDSTALFAQTSIGLARLPDTTTTFGSVIFIAGRLLCPALLALAALAIRGRVKR
ncbi:hypothetical protein [Micromonospora chalcea]|uniref:hypothetical protein n=1 Tax=Micromonospora chalcea TaxID=1874 RepID=UPI0037BB3ABD